MMDVKGFGAMNAQKNRNLCLMKELIPLKFQREQALVANVRGVSPL